MARFYCSSNKKKRNVVTDSHLFKIMNEFQIIALFLCLSRLIGWLVTWFVSWLVHCSHWYIQGTILLRKTVQCLDGETSAASGTLDASGLCVKDVLASASPSQCCQTLLLWLLLQPKFSKQWEASFFKI